MNARMIAAGLMFVGLGTCFAQPQLGDVGEALAGAKSAAKDMPSAAGKAVKVDVRTTGKKGAGRGINRNEGPMPCLVLPGAHGDNGEECKPYCEYPTENGCLWIRSRFGVIAIYQTKVGIQKLLVSGCYKSEEDARQNLPELRRAGVCR